MRKLAVLLLVAPLALAACGGSSSANGLKVDPVAYVRHAASRTAATTQHFTMTGSMTVAGQSGSLQLSGTGDYGSTPLRANLAVSISVPGRSFQLKEVLEGTTMYIHGVPAPGVGTDHKWLKVDLSRAGKAMHTALLGSVSQSPAELLKQLESAGTVTNIGADTINGAQTTHFRVTNVDLSKLVPGASIPSSSQAQLGPVDVWVGNDNGYVYRETASLTISESGHTGTLTIQEDFSKFGETVNVSVPPASDVLDVTGQVGKTTTVTKSIAVPGAGG